MSHSKYSEMSISAESWKHTVSDGSNCMKLLRLVMELGLLENGYCPRQQLEKSRKMSPEDSSIMQNHYHTKFISGTVIRKDIPKQVLKFQSNIFNGLLCRHFHICYFANKSIKISKSTFFRLVCKGVLYIYICMWLSAKRCACKGLCTSVENKTFLKTVFILNVVLCTCMNEWIYSTDNFSNQALVDFKIQSSHTEKAPKNDRQKRTSMYQVIFVTLLTNKSQAHGEPITDLYAENIVLYG